MVMASRPPRTSKSDNSSPTKGAAAATGNRTPGAELDAGATIKDSSLQRREIPSYSDSREARIAEAAYWRAERRGFTPGGEIDDWLEAEKEVDKEKSGESGSDTKPGGGRM
jgi:hypothetical protein